MESLIDQSIAERIDYEEKKRQQKLIDEDPVNQRNKYKQWKLERKCAVYDEFLENISAKNVATKIAEAKVKGKNYAILHNFSVNKLFGYVHGRKKIATKFDPYDKGTIFDLLTKSLPTGYQVHIDEPWKPNWFYEFRLYISWGELTFWDNVVLWSQGNDERLMPCDERRYQPIATK